MSKTIYIGGRLESKEKGNVVTGANAILDDTKGKKQNVINKETDDELARLEQSKQDNLNFDNTPTEDSTNPVTSGGVYTAEKALSDAIEAILLLIPSAATALNKLVDTNTMNSSISTATATFRGTYNAVSDLGLNYQATHAQIEAALDALGLTADNNDFAFVQIPVSDQSQDIAKTERFKFNGTNWLYEYDLNISGFTAAQWAAINSTITLALVQKLAALPTNAELLQALGLKQDVLTFDNAPTTDSNNPVKSGGIKNAIDTAVRNEATARENADTAIAGLIGEEKTRAEGVEGGLNTRLGAVEGSVTTIQGVIPSEATSSNKLVDNSSMTTYIGTIIDNIDATFNVTSTDGHVTLAITQINGVITSVQLTTSDIASAAALNLKASQDDLTALAGRVTTAEGNINTINGNITSLSGRVSTNETDIANLQQLYNNLQQSKPVPVTELPSTGQQQGVIYRLAGTTSYSDYMWNGSTWVLMATYNNAIDNLPTAGSDNLVKSGGVAKAIGELSEAFNDGYKESEYTESTSGYIDPSNGSLLEGYSHLSHTVKAGDIIRCKCYTGSNIRAYVIKKANNVVSRAYEAEDWNTQHNYDVQTTITAEEDGGTVYVNSINGGYIGLKIDTPVKLINGEYIEEHSAPISILKGEVYNHFNFATITTGVYINYNNGQEASSFNYRFASDFIPVVAGEKYTFPIYRDIFGDGVKYIACYNDSKQYLSTIEGTLNGDLLTITARGSYIRISGEMDRYYRTPLLLNFNQIMVVNSAIYPNRYYPYGEIITFDGELSHQMNQMYNPLFGKIALFNGDSICEANGDSNRGWAYRIGKKNNMLWKNYAIGGGTITDGGWDNYVISETQYEETPDYLIIEGGTNDADKCGSIIDGTFPQGFGTFDPAGYTYTFENNNFCGAVEYMFKNLVTQYPNTKIGFIIAPKMSHYNDETHAIYDDVNENFTAEHNNRRAYFEYLMKLCKKWGIKYLNLWDECKLNPWLHYEFGGADSLYVDGQHLTTKGYDIISTIIEEWMKTL